MAIVPPGAGVRVQRPRATTVRCNAPQREPRYRDTEWGRPRRLARWSLRELADRTGINIGTLSRIERGAQPTLKQARVILATYDEALGPEAVT